jgi:hypothetical protein
LQDELNEYLAERQIDGKSVLTWYHRQFKEAAQSRYCFPVSKSQQIHSQLAEMYQQETGVKKTIVLQKRNNRVWEDADRRVVPQHLTSRNIRKLNCLPIICTMQIE